MKKLLVFFLVAIFIILGVMYTAANAYSITPANQPRIGDSTAYILKDSGFPQIGNGRYYQPVPYPETPCTPDCVYQPTNEELEYWATLLTPNKITVTLTNNGTFTPWHATMTNSKITADASYYYDAYALELAKYNNQ